MVVFSQSQPLFFSFQLSLYCLLLWNKDWMCVYSFMLPAFLENKFYGLVSVCKQLRLPEYCASPWEFRRTNEQNWICFVLAEIEVCGVVIEDGEFMCKCIFVLSGTRKAKCIFVAEHIKESVYQSANIQHPYTYQRCISLLCIHRRTAYKHLSSFPRRKRAPFSALGFYWRRYICCGVITCQRWQLHRWTKLHIL
jgi:hypothetical protein